MPIALTINGATYQYPLNNEIDWGSNTTNWASAVTNGMLQKAGGSFPLTAEVDFGGSFGVKTLYYKSQTANPASTGVVRLANNTDAVVWRNAANNADLALKVNASNLLEFNGATFPATPGTVTSVAASSTDITVGGSPITTSGTLTLTLATVNGNVGSFGTATEVGTFTVNAKGLITAASNTSIQITEAQVTNLVTDLAGKQPLDATLTALAAYNTNGLITQTAADTFTGRTIVSSSAGLSVSNGDGVAGNPSLALDAAIQGWDNFNTNGLLTQTAANTFTGRTVVAGSSKITVANGNGVAGNPSIDVDQTQVDHDALLNFVANEHIDHSGVTLTAGVGLTGGGNITASRTFDVAAFKGSAAVTFGAIADGTVGDSSNTITVTGAAVGDPVAVGLPATVPAGFTYNAYVSSSDTVTVRAASNGGGTNAGDANATIQVIVLDYGEF